ncbi:MAG: hypothetical protein A3J59_00230 [Candidatus Buchananbacteria bacterium RIFCSPHIGHO2_02_FULL_56_16]|uniref:HTH HARE-type domain-containing protein n=1 Tax=Candidatus Buchananbacteria bacterium RIFCSPHIGHO2_02_FULL_56_16 TaxID=1797542 RepID=A0A1G1YJ12_9BACT|nr:MAG: hypothetical protein A3J59_00230 [Candidatus Buchananbacteria bacterium RIFCSPHIGHO2_02_FULL_56_16]
MTEETTFSEAIEQVMKNNGYYAPLKLIYKKFEKYRKFSGLTPLKTIQERVQRDKRFTRIGLGVYALTEHLDELPQVITPKTTSEKTNQRHSAIQGMIIEIGNMEGFDTYTPDRSKMFANKKLGNIATIKEFPLFTYEKITHSVKFVDVAWFNERGFPEKIFEVEDSTDFRGSLVKFAELQDFNTSFNLVASVERKTKYDREVSKMAFINIVSRCHFVNYADIEEYYNASLNYHKVLKSVIF